MDVGLLDKWYKKDSNAVPPTSILQPISSILKNFNNKVIETSRCVKNKCNIEIHKYSPDLENTKAAARGPGHLVGHHGENAKAVPKRSTVSVQQWEI